MQKLTYENQGYWDRRKRAEAWIDRAKSLKGQKWDEGPFIFYWIAFNALYGRHHETRKREGKGEIEDISWFLSRICKLDKGDGSLSLILDDIHIKRKMDSLLNNQFLSKIYWREKGRLRNFKLDLDDDHKKAQIAYERREFDEYLTIFFNRLLVLRNQIFHGCSTDKSRSNKGSLRPALAILEELVPQFLKIFKSRGQREKWGKVPYPRSNSPQHPK